MKEKRRSNEKRKEKSRDAARCRRSRETDIFMELAGALPVSTCEAAHLDKASVMRLAIAYLKTRTLMDAVPKPLAKPEISTDTDELFLKALDGFVLVLDNNGDMAYLSPNVKDYLGIAQMDLMGQSVYDYSHPCDHDEIRESLSLKASEIAENHPCNLFLRLKCTLTSKGRKVNLKSASFKVIHCTGRLIAHPSCNTLGIANTDNINNNNNDDAEKPEIAEDNSEKEPSVSLVVVASPVPHPSNIEVPLGKSTFLSKHNLNMKFTYADDKLAEFLGWESNDLMGQSVFEFYHALDNLSLDKSFKSLFSKGQCETMAYRFLNKKGGYAWVVTQATLIHCSRLQKPLSVVCVNYMLSGVEREDEVYSVRQLEARKSRLKEEPSCKSQAPAAAPRKALSENKPQAVTASILRLPEQSPRSQPTAVVRPRSSCNKENKAENSRDVKVKAARCEPEAVIQPPGGFVAPSLSEPAAYQLPPLGANRPGPQTATASIFAPRTEDMNTGFLMFCEDQPGLTMLKDEPEDLTHLAPTAGDVCVPLDDPPFLSDMLDEFILGSNYCPLLSPELSSEPSDLPETLASAGPTSSQPSATSSSSASSNNDVSTTDSIKDLEQTILSNDPLKTAADDCSSSDGDPFIYRDSSSRCSLATELHSPSSTKSPESSGGSDPLGSPYGPRSGKSLGTYGKQDDDGLLTMSFNDMLCDDELEMRAPYIPMCDQDETLQMLIFDDMVMWGPSDNEKKSKLLSDLTDENTNSSLAQLLTNESSLKQIKDHSEILVNPAQVLGQISLKNNTQDITAERERTNKRVHAYSSKSSLGNKRVKHSELDGIAVLKSATNTTNSSSNKSLSSGNNLSSLQKMLSNSVQSSQLLQQLVSQQTPKMRNWPEQLAGSETKSRLQSADKARLLLDDSCQRRTADEAEGLSRPARPTFKNSSLSRLDDEGGGLGILKDELGGTKPQQQQSNSVLMNLLVSGCDMPALESVELSEQLLSQVARAQLEALPPDKLSLSGLRITADDHHQQQHQHQQQLQQVPHWPAELGDELSPNPVRDKPPIMFEPPPILPTGYNTLGFGGFIPDETIGPMPSPDLITQSQLIGQTEALPDALLLPDNPLLPDNELLPGDELLRENELLQQLLNPNLA